MPHVAPFTVYLPATGEILSTGACHPADVPFQGGHVLAVESDPATMYVVDGALVARPALVDVSRKAMTVLELWSIPAPAGTKVYLDGALVGTSAGDPVEIDFAMPGIYALFLDPPFPHRPARVRVTVA